MNDLLKEAIADAKAVKEVALANAKLALEEAFTPRLQSMLSKKLSEEAEAEETEEPVEEYGFYNEADEEEEPAMEEGEEEEPAMEEAEDEEEPAMEEAEDEEEPMDEDLMEIIRQLEEDLVSSDIGGGDNKKPAPKASSASTQDKKEKLVQLVEEEGEEESEEVAEIQEILRALREEEETEEPAMEEAEEEVDIKEVLRALREEEADEEEEPAMEEAAAEEEEVAETKLREAYAVIQFLRSKINEVNLLNSKLLFSNKLFRKHSLSESQKMTVIENFDRASSLREVKLVFATLSEALKTVKGTTKQLKESFASKPIASTRPSKNILTEGDVMATRLRKLAGLK